MYQLRNVADADLSRLGDTPFVSFFSSPLEHSTVTMTLSLEASAPHVAGGKEVESLVRVYKCARI